VSADGATFTPARHTRAGYIGGVTSNRIPVVKFTPNGIASALIEATSGPVGDRTTCGQFNEIRVSAPSESPPDPRFLPAAIPDCGQLEVHPVVTGPSGNFGAAP
jgi:hypothetical protein